MDVSDYGSNRTRTSRVICPWIWKNCWIWLCLHSIIYKYWPISTKLGQNVCDQKISDEFDYGSNRTRSVQVICPLIRKFAIFDFVYTLASANIDQSVPNLATIFMPIRSQMSLIMGQIEQNIQSYLPLNLEKLLNMTLFTLYHLQILTNQHQTWSKCMWSKDCGWVRLWI